jgi:hypothetical protein
VNRLVFGAVAAAIAVAAPAALAGGTGTPSAAEVTGVSVVPYPLEITRGDGDPVVVAGAAPGLHLPYQHISLLSVAHAIPGRLPVAPAQAERPNLRADVCARGGAVVTVATRAGRIRYGPCLRPPSIERLRRLVYRTARSLYPGSGDAAAFLNPPFYDARAVASIAAARPKLTFVPVVPPQLGRPSRLFVHAQAMRRREQALALEYRSRMYGRFVVVECLRGSNVQSLEPECLAPWSAEFSGSFVRLRLPGRADGFVVSDLWGNEVSWADRSVGFDVAGSNQSLSAADAWHLANIVASRAS